MNTFASLLALAGMIVAAPIVGFFGGLVRLYIWGMAGVMAVWRA